MRRRVPRATWPLILLAGALVAGTTVGGRHASSATAVLPIYDGIPSLAMALLPARMLSLDSRVLGLPDRFRLPFVAAPVDS